MEKKSVDFNPETNAWDLSFDEPDQVKTGAAKTTGMSPRARQISSTLGGIGVALGREGSPARNLGLQVQRTAQAQAYSDLTSDLLAGKDISTLDTSLIDPDQIISALGIQAKATKQTADIGQTTARTDLVGEQAKSIAGEPEAVATQNKFEAEQAEQTRTHQAALQEAEITSQEALAASGNVSAEARTKAQVDSYMAVLEKRFGKEEGSERNLTILQSMISNGMDFESVRRTANSFFGGSTQVPFGTTRFPQGTSGGGYDVNGRLEGDKDYVGDFITDTLGEENAQLKEEISKLKSRLHDQTTTDYTFGPPSVRAPLRGKPGDKKE